MQRRSWIEPEYSGAWGAQTLPYGVFSDAAGGASIFTRINQTALDLRAAVDLLAPQLAPLFSEDRLNPLLAAGRETWSEVRMLVTEWVTDPAFDAVLRPHLHALDALRGRLPMHVADWVDFYGSADHATTMSSFFRPGQPGLPKAWLHMPMGYHGRAGTVIVSGDEVHRPSGQRTIEGAEAPVYGPSRRLDIEAELGFVVGTESRLGEPIEPRDLAEHVFGVVLVNDWSARDIQSFESKPLGPFLGKSFATSISSWITPLDAFSHAWCEPPVRRVELLPYLGDASAERGLDIAVTVRLNGTIVSRPPYASMYWTPGQMLAQMTANGATARPGDLFGSGTISGPSRDQRGSLMEMTDNGRTPLELDDGSARTFLLDGDEVALSADAPGPDGTRIGLGDVVARIVSEAPHRVAEPRTALAATA